MTANGVLEAGVYYFQVGSDLAENAERYPVLRSFRDYVFREEHIGPHGRTALPSGHDMERQLPNACVMRGQPHAEDAHMVPATEWEYWKSNKLHLYAVRPESSSITEVALFNVVKTPYNQLLPPHIPEHCRLMTLLV